MFFVGRGVVIGAGDGEVDAQAEAREGAPLGAGLGVGAGVGGHGCFGASLGGGTFACKPVEVMNQRACQGACENGAGQDPIPAAMEFHVVIPESAYAIDGLEEGN